MAESMPTYYDVLQVERSASPQSIRTAYRRLAQKYHPDKMPGNANAVRAMAAINAAYEVLSDPQRRTEHDRWIRRAERPAQPAVVVPAPPANLWEFMHPSTSWPWYLLFGTMLAAAGTIATAVYLTAMPARASSTPVRPAVTCEAVTAQPSSTAACTAPPTALAVK
jgi:hypothetical protein